MVDLNECVKCLKAFNEQSSLDLLDLKTNLEVLCALEEDSFGGNADLSREFLDQILKCLQHVCKTSSSDDVHCVYKTLLAAANSDSGLSILQEHEELCSELLSQLPSVQEYRHSGPGGWTNSQETSTKMLLGVLRLITRGGFASWHWTQVSLVEVISRLSNMFLQVGHSSMISVLAMEILTYICRSNKNALGPAELRALNPNKLLAQLVRLSGEDVFNVSVSRIRDGSSPDHGPLLASLLLLMLEKMVSDELPGSKMNNLIDLTFNVLEASVAMQDYESTFQAALYLYELIGNKQHILRTVPDFTSRLAGFVESMQLTAPKNFLSNGMMCQLLYRIIETIEKPGLELLFQFMQFGAKWTQFFVDHIREKRSFGCDEVKHMINVARLLQKVAEKLQSVGETQDSEQNNLVEETAELLASLFSLATSQDPIFKPAARLLGCQLLVAVVETLIAFCQQSGLSSLLSTSLNCSTLMDYLQCTSYGPLSMAVLNLAKGLSQQSVTWKQLQNKLESSSLLHDHVAVLMASGTADERTKASLMLSSLPPDSFQQNRTLRRDILQDPDYQEDWQNRGGGLQQQQQQHLKSVETAQADTRERIKKVIASQFDAEIKKREEDAFLCQERLREASKQLAMLRYYISAAYYQKQAPSGEQIRLHPAIKSITSRRSRENPKEVVSSLPVPAKSTIVEKRSSKEAPVALVIKRPRYIPPLEKPSTQSIPRASNVRTKQRLVVGNISKYLRDELSREDSATHKWMVYVRGPPYAPDLSHLVQKVRFFLHSSYQPHDVIEISSPPYHLCRRGWGEFPVRVQIHFLHPENRPIDVIHQLKLDHTYSGLQTLGAETVVDAWLLVPPSKDNKPVNTSTERELKQDKTEAAEPECSKAENNVGESVMPSLSIPVTSQASTATSKMMRDTSITEQNITIPATVSDSNVMPGMAVIKNLSEAEMTVNVSKKSVMKPAPKKVVLVMNSTANKPQTSSDQSTSGVPAKQNIRVIDKAALQKLISTILVHPGTSSSSNSPRPNTPVNVVKQTLSSAAIGTTTPPLLNPQVFKSPGGVVSLLKPILPKLSLGPRLICVQKTNSSNPRVPSPLVLNVSKLSLPPSLTPSLTPEELEEKLHQKLLQGLAKRRVDDPGNALLVLMKNLPAIAHDSLPAMYKIWHPYIADSIQQFLSWPVGKQRAAEVVRAQEINRLLEKQGFSRRNAWDIARWSRRFGFTPTSPVEENHNAPPNKYVPKTYCEPSTVLGWLAGNRVHDAGDEHQIVDVESLSPPATTSTINKILVKEIPTVVETLACSLVRRLAGQVRAILPPCDQDDPTVTAQDVLLEVMDLFCEDLIRRSLAAAWDRLGGIPQVLTLEHVREALIARPEFDVLTNTGLGVDMDSKDMN